MRLDLEQRIEKAVDAAIVASIPNYSDFETYSAEHCALYELVRGEADEDLLRTFAFRLSWCDVRYSTKPHDDTRIETARVPGLSKWSKTVSREASWDRYEEPGLSPTLLRRAAEDIERLVDAGLLQEERACPCEGGPSAYRMPAWCGLHFWK
jgi:hypothetical protein